jgi:hypothetical protein
MSESSRRLSYRKRKKLGLTFSEAFMEESGPHKARSVDRGYASVMSPASVEQGDEQSEWDERQARIDQPDGLSRIMSDLSASRGDDEAAEEIFVGEGNMKEAMLLGFVGELDKLGASAEESDLSDAMFVAFLDELAEQGCLGEEEVEKLAGAMDIYRARRAMAASKTGPKTGRLWRSSRYGKGRLKGQQRSATVRAERLSADPSATAGELQAAQTKGAKAAQRLGKWYDPRTWRSSRRASQRASRSGAREAIGRTQEVVGEGADIQRVKNYKKRVARGEQAPVTGEQPAPGGQVAPPPGKPAAGGQPAAPPAEVPVGAGAPAEAGWFGSRWNALTNPVAEAYQSGAGLGAYPGAIWQGMKASPLLGGIGAGLAGMALLPPVMRATGLKKESPGAVPGYVNIPG